MKKTKKILLASSIITASLIIPFSTIACAIKATSPQEPGEEVVIPKNQKDFLYTLDLETRTASIRGFSSTGQTDSIEHLELPDYVVPFTSYKTAPNDETELLLDVETIRTNLSTGEKEIKVLEKFLITKIEQVEIEIDSDTKEITHFVNKNINSIKFPKNVEILNIPFGSNNLEELNFPNSVREIGGFAGNKIKFLTLPPNLEKLYDFAFIKNKINKIDFSKAKNLKKIETSSVFAENNLLEVTIPETIEELRISTFWDNPIIRVNFLGKNTKWGSIGKTKKEENGKKLVYYDSDSAFWNNEVFTNSEYNKYTKNDIYKFYIIQDNKLYSYKINKSNIKEAQEEVFDIVIEDNLIYTYKLSSNSEGYSKLYGVYDTSKPQEELNIKRELKINNNTIFLLSINNNAFDLKDYKYFVNPDFNYKKVYFDYEGGYNFNIKHGTFIGSQAFANNPYLTLVETKHFNGYPESWSRNIFNNSDNVKKISFGLTISSANVETELKEQKENNFNGFGGFIDWHLKEEIINEEQKFTTFNHNTIIEFSYLDNEDLTKILATITYTWNEEEKTFKITSE